MTRLFRFIIDKALSVYGRWEKWLLGVLLFLFVLSASVLLFRFYRESTVLVPATGGTYIEGSVGELQPLNPWFIVTNDVNRDIVSLVFSGLLRYNPQTKDIEDDLASYTVSKDGKIYTLTLKDTLFWHDSTEEEPHPVTSEDILFTYQTIQDLEFPNSLLRQNFQGVTMEALNEKTVQFRLEEPYGFFPSNLTIGLLPKKSFADIPVRLLDQTLDFGFAPIGAGPYKLKNILETELSTEITLERFERTLEPMYRLERIVFRIFPDYQTLLSDLRNLDGIRLVPYTDTGEPAVPNRFKAHSYSLPQYVALFFNLERPALQDQKLRLGLQLGTNKQELVDALGESKIVDTPLLEIDTTDWRYSFDPKAAQGALFESAWYFPEKIQLQRLLEQKEANDTGILKMDPVVLLDTGAALTIEGPGAGLSGKHTINGVPLQSHPTQSGSWKVALPTYAGTGNIKLGMNLIRLMDEKGNILDSHYLRRTNTSIDYQNAMQEQSLVDRFIKSRAGTLPEGDRITAQDLTFDKGYLRLRRADDVIGTRINDANQKLVLTLLTSPSPPNHKKVAEMVQRQWRNLGIDVKIEIPETRSDFEQRLLKREYDILLFGQSLLDNLDSYPYWHSSGVQHVTGKRSDLRIDAYNLSQYASFEADALLETIRGKTTEEERTVALKKLQDILKRDVPAVFLYSPLYTYAQREGILGTQLGHLSLHSDRFLTLHRWYVQQERIFKQDSGWLSFFGWMSRLFWQEKAVPSV